MKKSLLITSFIIVYITTYCQQNARLLNEPEFSATPTSVEFYLNMAADSFPILIIYSWREEGSTTSIGSAWHYAQIGRDTFTIADLSPSHTYELLLSVGQGQDTATVTFFTVGITGISERLDDKFRIGYNSISQGLSITSDGDIPLYLHIINILGQSVFSREVQSDFITIDMTTYPEGTYIVTCNTGVTQKSKRIVVE